LDAAPKRLLIGGQWCDAGGGGVLDVEDPATGAVVAQVADGQVQDALAALAAADAARDAFAASTPRERGDVLRRAYELIMARIDDLALLMTIEMGKPLAESKAEIVYAADFFHWFAGQ